MLSASVPSQSKMKPPKSPGGSSNGRCTVKLARTRAPYAGSEFAKAKNVGLDGGRRRVVVHVALELLNTAVAAAFVHEKRRRRRRPGLGVFGDQLTRQGCGTGRSFRTAALLGTLREGGCATLGGESSSFFGT